MPSDVTWIKLTTGMFDDEKIRLIEAMPDADTILIIWIKLIILAGRCNSRGYIFISENIPYSIEELATAVSRPLNTVKLAIATFKRFEMITLQDNGYLLLNNFEKHQNIEGLELIREQNRKRVEKFRNKQKLLPQSSNVTGNVTVTLGNAIEQEQEEDKELDKDTSSCCIEKQEKEKAESNVNEKLSAVAKMYEDNFGLIVPMIAEQIKSVIDDYPLEWFKKAFEISVRENKRRWSYVLGILKNWSENGVSDGSPKPNTSVIPGQRGTTDEQRNEFRTNPQF